MENINCRRLSGSLHQLSAYLYLWNMQERVASKINIAAPSVEQSVHNFIRARHSSRNFDFFLFFALFLEYATQLHQGSSSSGFFKARAFI